MQTFWKAVPYSKLKLLDWVVIYSHFPFLQYAVCLACPKYLGSGVLRELLWCDCCVAFSRTMERERQKEAIALSLLSTERQIYSLLLSMWCLPMVFCFDASFTWQHRKDSREVGIYQHKMNWHKGWVKREGLQLEYKSRLGLNCFFRPQEFFFLFWHWKMKEAFPA